MEDKLKQKGLWCKQCNKPFSLEEIPYEEMARMEKEAGRSFGDNKYVIICQSCNTSLIIEDDQECLDATVLLKEYWGIE